MELAPDEPSSKTPSLPGTPVDPNQEDSSRAGVPTWARLASEEMSMRPDSLPRTPGTPNREEWSRLASEEVSIKPDSLPRTPGTPNREAQIPRTPTPTSKKNSEIPTILCSLLSIDEITYNLTSRVQERLTPGALSGDEGVALVQAHVNSVDPAEVYAQEGRIPMQDLLMNDVPKERPSTADMNKIELPRISYSHTRTTHLLCLSHKLNCRALQLFALREAGRFLTNLILEDCSLKDDGIAVVAAALGKQIRGKQICRLRLLSLTNNFITLEGASHLASALKTNTLLTTLHCDWNFFGAQGCRSLAEGLRENHALTKLDLEANDVRDEGFTCLAEALKVNTTLKELLLVSENASIKGVTAFAESLNSNSTLQSLHLSGNNVYADGGVGLLDALENHNKTMHRLYLDSAELGAGFYMKLARMLQKSDCHLKALYASGSACGDDGALAIADALSVNTSLAELSMEKCGIGEDGLEAMQKVARGFRNLSLLQLSGNNATPL